MDTELGSGSEPDLGSHDEFFDALAKYLGDHELQDVFGIGSLEGHERKVNIEMTEGKANIMLPEGSIGESSLMPAFWIFKDGSENEACNCFTYCPEIRGVHQGEIHGCG